MRFAIGATAVFAFSLASAHEGHGAHSKVEEAEPSTSVAVAKPTFTPTKIQGLFLEQFTDDWETRWKPSSAKKFVKSGEEEWAYVGTWAVEEPTVLKGIEGDKGLVVKDKAAHHAISAKFAKAIDNKDKTLVIQYEVKLQNGLECGGAYMKLLQENSNLHLEEFANSSPYVIMFGPDKCGATNKVHFIFKHKHPTTGEYEEKHLNTPPTARIVKTTTLYTLIVRPDQSFEIKIDGESMRNGTLLEDFTPPVNPEAEIDDESDTKPADWVDDARIADPEATKPEDWDEDAPFEIVDEKAEMPADWLENEPTTIPDPEAEKPEDWDDEEDGDWVPPMVPNPKCDEVSGCGKWEAPMTKNPAYKGKWTAPFIDNPLYKGVWAPRKVRNPEYFEDKSPSNFQPIGAIGFELWSMQNDILFDNIYVGHSVEDAEKLRLETFVPKHAAEKADEAANRPKPKDTPKTTVDVAFTEDPIRYVTEKVNLFVEIAKRDPVEAAKSVPEVAGGLGAIAVTILALLISALVGSGAAPSKEQVKAQVEKTKKTAADAKDRAAEAVATGAENVKAEVNKRNTSTAS